MPNAVDVAPSRWSELLVIFDNGSYSAVWGRLDERAHKDIGVRWNGDEGSLGYPNSRGYPQWYVEHPFLWESVLLGIKAELLRAETTPQILQYLANVNTALRESRQQQQAAMFK